MIFSTKLFCLFRILMFRCGQSVQPIDDVKISLSVYIADNSANGDIARTKPTVQRDKFGLRFDDQSLPATFIKPEGNIVSDRMPSTYIEVKAALLATECK